MRLNTIQKPCNRWLPALGFQLLNLGDKLWGILIPRQGFVVILVKNLPTAYKCCVPYRLVSRFPKSICVSQKIPSGSRPYIRILHLEVYEVLCTKMDIMRPGIIPGLQFYTCPQWCRGREKLCEDYDHESKFRCSLATRLIRNTWITSSHPPDISVRNLAKAFLLKTTNTGLLC